MCGLIFPAVGGCFQATGDKPDAGTTSAVAGSSSGGSGSTTSGSPTDTSSSTSGINSHGSNSSFSTGATGSGTTTGVVGSSTATTSSANTSAASGSGTSGATSGTTSGGTSSGGTDAGFCAQTEYRTGWTRGCNSDADCNCGQWCVADPLFWGDLLYGPLNVCETRCSADSDCPNAVSICTSLAVPLNPSDVGKTCTVNLCNLYNLYAGSDAGPAAATDAGPGATCDVDATGTGGGTCVPLSEIWFDGQDALICVPDGTGTTCLEGSTSSDPFYAAASGGTGDYLLIPSPQARDAGGFCGAGEGCLSPYGAVGVTGSCRPLCPRSDGGGVSCAGPMVCVAQDPKDTTWGFCLPCVPSGSDGGQAGQCITNQDCCEGVCAIGLGQIGTCRP